MYYFSFKQNGHGDEGKLDFFTEVEGTGIYKKKKWT